MKMTDIKRYFNNTTLDIYIYFICTKINYFTPTFATVADFL